MNLSNQETVIVNPRRLPKQSSPRTGWLWLAAFIALAAWLLEIGNAERQVPAEWFREVPVVTQLNPIVAESRDRLIAQTSKIGIPIAITDGFRSDQEQDALYRKGRGDGGAVVTQAKGGESFHNYGLAIDFAIRDAKGKVIWDMKYDGNRNGKSDWMEVVALAKEIGFTWGGDWKSFPDYPHLQMDFGYTIDELQRGWLPPEQPQR